MRLKFDFIRFLLKNPQKSIKIHQNCQKKIIFNQKNGKNTPPLNSEIHKNVPLNTQCQLLTTENTNEPILPHLAPPKKSIPLPS